MMKIWMYPKINESNKYNELFAESIEENGIEVVDYKWTLNKEGFKNISNMKKGDILHVHWPSHAYYRKENTKFFVKLTLMFFYIKMLKSRGIRFVWTVHNIFPHENKGIAIEKKIRKWLAKQSDLLFALGKTAKKNIISEFNVSPDKVKVIKHGHYYGKYERGNNDFRKKLNIAPDETVFLFVGQIKPYKGIEDLAEIFTSHEFEKSKLIIAGKPSNEMVEYIKNVEDDKIIKILEFINDQDMIDLIEASDFVVLPYKKITTSGSAILAASYGKPVIISDTLMIRDYLDEKVSLFYDAKDSNGLLKAIKTASEHKKLFDKENFEEFRRQLDWDEIGKVTSSYYKSLR